MKEKQALHLQKGDVLLGPKGQKAKVEVVINKNDMRDIEAIVRLPTGKKVLKYDWKDMVPLWSPPQKKWRYGLLFWLAKKLKTPIKRA